MKVTCTKCKIAKSEDEFYKANQKANGLRSRCKKCELEYEKSEHGKNVRKKYRNSEHAKNVRKKYEKNRGYVVNKKGRKYIAYHNEKSLGYYKTHKAAELVIAKSKLREAKRKLENEQLLHDDYYDTL